MIRWHRVWLWVALILLCALCLLSLNNARAATVTWKDAATGRVITCPADVQSDGNYSRVTAVSVTVYVNCDPIFKSGFE